MSNMYFTIAAFFISAFLFIVFNLKKKIKKTDNVLYNRLLIFNLLDVIFMLTVLYMGYKDIDNIKLVTLINKLDFLMYLLYGGTLLVYTCNVLKPSPQYVKGASLFAAILAMGGSLLIAILPLSLYKDANLMYAYGPAVNATFSICAIYTVVILGFIPKILDTANIHPIEINYFKDKSPVSELPKEESIVEEIKEYEWKPGDEN